MNHPHRNEPLDKVFAFVNGSYRHKDKKLVRLMILLKNDPQYNNITPASHQRIEQVLSELRDQGWMVAIHNDYWQDGKYYTFWLMTSRDGRYVKGESSMEHGGDLGALNQIKAAIALLREGEEESGRGK